MDGITDSMDMSLNKFQETVEDRGAWQAVVHRVAETVEDRGAWQAVVHRVAESWTRLSS